MQASEAREICAREGSEVMSDFDVSKLQKWIAKPSRSASRRPERRRGTKSETAARHEQVVQLNLRVGASTKKRMKHLAARDDINLATLLTRMVDLYEKQHGALPDITGKPR
jgi:hypothetical protein